MIRLSASGVENWPSARALAALRRDFERRRFVLLRGLLEPALLERALAKTDAARFEKDDLYGVTSMESSMTGDAAGFLTFCFHHPRLFEFVEAVTGCSGIRRFAGRLIRTRPRQGHFIDWHSDAALDPQRLASISLNVSRAPYRGGRLQFRRSGERRIVSEFANTRCGDAVLFSSYGELVHRNTPVVGTEPKTAFAGWFYSDHKEGVF